MDKSRFLSRLGGYFRRIVEKRTLRENELLNISNGLFPRFRGKVKSFRVFPETFFFAFGRGKIKTIFQNPLKSALKTFAAIIYSKKKEILFLILCVLIFFGQIETEKACELFQQFSQ